MTGWLERLRRRLAGPAPATAVLGPEAATDAERRAMARALELARDAAAMGEVPVGAVVCETAGGAVLGEGHNRREVDADPTAHAELLAIRAACDARGDWRLNDCTLVVTLEPCPMCAGLIVNARVGRVVYGADDPKAGACRSLMAITADGRLNHRPKVVAGVEAEEAGALLSGFFRNLRARRRGAGARPSDGTDGGVDRGTPGRTDGGPG